jgi:putative SOS response-associated peptidase YedK
MPFYEWKKIGAAKQPYALVSADGLPLALAGLWSAGRTGRPETLSNLHDYNDDTERALRRDP